MKLGIVCFANDGGLGAQTRRLTYMLKPDKILVVDSSGFSKNTKQNWHWYDQFSGYKVDGFPTNKEYQKFLSELTHVLVCENPLNTEMYTIARRMGVKTFCQTNYEFCENLNNPTYPIPDMFLMPSYWMVEEMEAKFGVDRVKYLPPPLDLNEFKEAREINFNRKGQKVKLLHIVGTLATHDRNGTLDLIEAVKKTESNYELVIKSQHELPDEYMISHRKIKYQIGNTANNADLYKDFDAMILPRRYGGLSLTTNEALAAGLPVIMTNISPNNKLLPYNWLVKASKVTEFYARTLIDVYQSDIDDLARKIDWFVDDIDLNSLKIEAFDIAYNNFADSQLKQNYMEVLGE